MTTDAKHIKNPRSWLAAIGLIAAIVIIVIIVNSQTGSSDPNDLLRNTIARAVQGNIDKLSSAVIVWNSERKFFGPWSDKPQRAGSHQLWWDGKRTAISYEMSTTVTDPNGQASSTTETKFMTYDGRKFRVAEIPATPAGKVEVVILKKPEYSPDENYLQDIGWFGYGLLGRGLTKPTEPGTQSHSTEGNLITVTFHNSRTGQIGVRTYDTEKAHAPVTRESYAKEDTLQSRTTIQYKQVSGGAWFPISIITEGYNIQNGELISRSKMEVDVNKSIFNNPSAIPTDVFNLKIGPNAEIKDMTSLKTKLKMRLNDL